VAAALVAPTFAIADSTSNSEFVSDTNSARSQNGLRAYSASSDLTSIANEWAAHMASTRTLAHNPNATSQVCCWQAMGENVGVGGSVSEIQQAFMASSPHRANILSSTYTQVGIGTARGSDGRLYVDELFRRPTGTTAPRTYTAPTQTTTRSTPARASRSGARAPLAMMHLSALHPSTLHPSTLHPSTWHRNPVVRGLPSAAFLRQVREMLPARVHADPVGGAFGYLTVLDSIIHAARHSNRR
jgi:hypothetical protein